MKRRSVYGLFEAIQAQIGLESHRGETNHFVLNFSFIILVYTINSKFIVNLHYCNLFFSCLQF